MDIVTHGLTGLLVARAATGRALGKAGAAAVAGALAPDLDLIARLWDPVSSLTVHRLSTHSFMGGLAVALTVAGAIRPAGGREFVRLAGLAYLGVLTHVALDILTPSGAGVLWPFSPARWAVGSLYMIDPLFASIAVAGLTPVSWCRRPGSHVARAGLLLLAAYTAGATAVMKDVETRWAEMLHGQDVRVLRAGVVPAFPGPFHWLALAETPSGIVRVDFWAREATISRAEVFERGSSGPQLSHVDDHRAAKAFLGRARFPLRRVIADGDQWVVVYEELAFVDHPFGGPMVLRLRVDRSGVVQTAALDHRL
jgi:membrane-bound metal-dependent hydrolase YbcI (DUF457 family)